MKRSITWILILVFMVTMTLISVGCKEETPQEEATGKETPQKEATVVAEEELTFYWISHGQEGDPIWILAINGAKEAGETLGVKVNTSFHRGDVATQKEAFGAAIAAGANGIATSSPELGVMTSEVKLAKEKGIPVVFFNTDDPDTARDAYVGADYFTVGKIYASYLVDNGLVKTGDKVWMPVEVPGATYQVGETAGIASIFDPLEIEYEIFDANYDPALVLSNMTDYLVAHGSDISAMIGLGDLVTGATKKAFDAAGMAPGTIPVIGWGNSSDTANAVKEGYVNAAMWQYPDAQGYLPIYMMYEASKGKAINYTATTLGLYDKSNADYYIGLTTAE